MAAEARKSEGMKPKKKKRACWRGSQGKRGGTPRRSEFEKERGKDLHRSYTGELKGRKIIKKTRDAREGGGTREWRRVPIFVKKKSDTSDARGTIRN